MCKQNTNQTFFPFFFFFTEHKFHPSQHDIIMPPVSKAGAFLLVLVVTSFILTLFTTTVVAASSVTNVGGKNDLDLVRKIKNSKKTNANKHNDDTCTMEPFVGKSQYTNCEGTEMEVDIACANKGNAAADGTLTKEICSYSDQPVQYDDEAPPATAAAGCGDHGSFDPKTHLIRDHATGRCRLNFVALADSCDAALAEAGASSRFGVMVEAPLRTSAGAHDRH